MRQSFFLFPLFILAAMSSLPAQSFSDHQWEHRLILLFTTDVKQSDYLKQLDAFQALTEEMAERKLLVYHLMPTQIGIGVQAVEIWQPSAQHYLAYKQTESAFELQLIGLDGGVKRLEMAFLDPEQLFALIDGMPMRQAEIRKKK